MNKRIKKKVIKNIVRKLEDSHDVPLNKQERAELRKFMNKVSVTWKRIIASTEEVINKVYTVMSNLVKSFNNNKHSKKE